MSLQAIQFIAIVVAGLFSLVVATSTLVWFIADQFKKTRAEFWKGISELHNSMTDALEAHKSEDRQQFEALKTQVWQIEVRNARRDGSPYPEHPH